METKTKFMPRWRLATGAASRDTCISDTPMHSGQFAKNAGHNSKSNDSDDLMDFLNSLLLCTKNKL